MLEGKTGSGAAGLGVVKVAVILLVLVSSVALFGLGCTVKRHAEAGPSSGVIASVQIDHHVETCHDSSSKVGVTTVHRGQDRPPAVDRPVPWGWRESERPVDGASHSWDPQDAAPRWRLSGRALLVLAQISRT